MSKRQAEGPGKALVSAWGIVGLSLALLAILVVALYTMIVLWPSAPTTTPPVWFSIRLGITIDQRLLMIVLTAGCLGGLAHSVRSLYWYVGNRRLYGSWVLMYLALPFTGAGLALLIYLLLRGGLTTSSSTSADVNPYGIAAVSSMAGLFSREAVEKLKHVFETLLTTAEKGADSIASPSVTRIVPLEGPPGSTVTIEGASLSSVEQVRFGSGVAMPVTAVSETSLEVLVPQDAHSGVLTVISPNGVSATSHDAFEVKSAQKG